MPRMNITRVLGIALVVAGVLGLVYGGFNYTRDTHQAQLGPLELSFVEKDRINVPVWAGAALVGVGALLLVLGGRKG